mmetsp:Transcript_14840/g.36989  ORF Transcript_14840/g.36989 Transcript_14840/m.36989 type:complete len:323 (-) Transcript_14840:316-1284(-)|eukprot:CAMPEP_0178992140 /NCGR_PEP_ID=MMETSP0795-20121207/5937_1 /TAXON_ID=88552 /ORGANISM="Amoebophrya sp., Strain Ameob2" /LENGTH=322 /DNA_ID=CAMNT_0020683965 /DNA_START=133 /DNA_END=1101 /DNA_ORIENTATION=+
MPTATRAEHVKLQLEEASASEVEDGAAGASSASDALDDWTPVLIRVFQDRLKAPGDFEREQLAELREAVKTLKAKEAENGKPGAGRAGLIRRNKAGHVLGLPFEKNTFVWAMARSVVQGECEEEVGARATASAKKGSRGATSPPPPPPGTKPNGRAKKPAPAAHEQKSSSCLRKCFCFRLLVEDPQLKKATVDNTAKFVPNVHRCRVVDVYDGDTITVVAKTSACNPPQLFKVRLARIDTPEMKGKGVGAKEKALAVAARDAVRELILGKIVLLEDVGLEKYGRLLAEVVLPGAGRGLNVNDWLLQKGHAKLYDGGTKDVNW